jgi:hypothetical protein
MKSKSSHLSGSFRGILIGTLLFFLAGCNNQPVEQVKMDNGEMIKSDSNKMVSWLGFKVEFKSNTTEEMRDKSIRAIESVIMDSARVLQLKYPAFSPIFLVGKSLFADTLTYTVNTVTGKNLYAAIKDTTCLCKNNCGICKTLMNSTNAPIGPGDPFASIKHISDLDLNDYFR